MDTEKNQDKFANDEITESKYTSIEIDSKSESDSESDNDSDSDSDKEDMMNAIIALNEDVENETKDEEEYKRSWSYIANRGLTYGFYVLCLALVVYLMARLVSAFGGSSSSIPNNVPML